MLRTLLTTLILVALAPGAAIAITAGQIDTFENGTTQGWSEGAPSPNKPTNVASGGPAGDGDNYLSNVSSGVPGPGGRMVMFNQGLWRGDYVDAGVTQIRFDARNFGNSTLNLRVAFEGLATRWVSTAAQTVSNDGSWQTLTFDLSAMSSAGGAASLEQVMAAVGAMRILSVSGTVWQGDAINGSLGVDNIEAMDDGVPVQGTTWGRIKGLYP